MKRFLITAGPTRESLDAVRYFSNLATGRFGIILSELAAQAGLDVTLVLGPTQLAPTEGVNVVSVVSAQEMFEAVKAHFDACDCFVASAAVADYRPAKVIEGKLKKGDGPLTIELERTPDILAWAGEHRRDDQILVGFALESDPDPALAEAKRVRKMCDYLVHNSPANFGDGGGLIRLLSDQGEFFAEEISKEELARRVLKIIQTTDLGQSSGSSSV